MTDYTEQARKDGSGSPDDTPRRRSTDLPPPLDCSTRELVQNIVDYKPNDAAPRKSFIRKLLDRNAE